MEPGQLFIERPSELFRGLLGLLIFLAPGVAITDRILPGRAAAMVLAPVFSFTALLLAGVAGSYLLSMPVTAASTVLLALGITALAASWRLRPRAAPLIYEAPRVKAAMQWEHRAGLAVAVALVALMAALPHLPGDLVENQAALPGALADRALDGLGGTQWPYPVHVDEHRHMALQAEVVRAATADIGEPYTGAASDTGIASVSGLRTERGFDVAIAQLHLLTGFSFAALASFMPPFWAALTAASTWYMLRGRPGAVASAALVAATPTALLVLGPGYLVPISFATAWVIAVVAAGDRLTGGLAIVTSLFLVVAAALIHIVAGLLAVVAAAVMLAAQGPPLERARRVATLVLPLALVAPAYSSQVVDALRIDVGLPYAKDAVLLWGVAGFIAAAIGTAWAFWERRMAGPHRAMVVLALITGTLMALSWELDHSNDAMARRPLFIFFASIAVLAGTGIGLAAKAMHRLPGRTWQRPVAALAAIVLVSVVLAPSALQQVNEPHYRVFDERSWAAVEAFAAAPVGPGDVFLAHPWQAQVLQSVSGAHPYTVLFPGTSPARAEAHAHHEATGGSAAWFKARGIDAVVSQRPPSASYEQWSQDVFLLRDAG